MNLNCVGFYSIKSSKGFSKEITENPWINANLSINAELDRHILEIKHIGEEDDIYDEDEDDKGLKRMITKIKLSDFKSCESRGCQRYKLHMIYVLLLIPKFFAKAQKMFLAFFSEDVQIYWYKNLETILTHKFQNSHSSAIIPDQVSPSSIEQFMIDNDVYEGSNMPGEYTATVIDNEKSKEIGIKGQYILIVTDTGLELRQESVYELVKFWEIKNIRKFGENNNVFFMALGNHSEEGPGVLSFKVNQCKAFWEQLIKCKDNCLKNKQNRTSVLKKPEPSLKHQESSEMKVETNRDSIQMSLAENFTYGTGDIRLSTTEERRQTSFEPPRIAPPPIPPAVPKQLFDETE